LALPIGEPALADRRSPSVIAQVWPPVGSLSRPKDGIDRVAAILPFPASRREYEMRDMAV